MKSIILIPAIIAFFAGFACCFVSILFLTWYFFFYSSPKYVEKAERKDTEKVSQLSLQGHVRISKELLSVSDILRRDNDNGELFPLT